MTKWFIRIGYIVALFLLLSPVIIIIAFVLSFFYHPSECHLDSRRIFPSPDHAWVAVVENHTCAWGLRMDVPADWSEVYLVTERPVPLRIIPILTTKELPPDIAWPRPNVLQIRIFWPYEFTLWVRNANGVRIDMRYGTAAWVGENVK